jgi:hypothetical protein
MKRQETKSTSEINQMVERLTLCNSDFSEYLICVRFLLCKPVKTATLAVRIILLGACRRLPTVPAYTTINVEHQPVLMPSANVE